MARDKGKPGPMTRVAVRVLVGKKPDVQGPAVEQELRDIADGKPAQDKDGKS